MKVTVVQAGGLAGLVTTTSVDAAALGAADADALAGHVERAGLLGASAGTTAGTAIGTAPRSEPGPDRFDQEITVEHDGAVTHLRVTDRDASTGVRDLVRFVRTAPGATQRVAPPG